MGTTESIEIVSRMKKAKNVNNIKNNTIYLYRANSNIQFSNAQILEKGLFFLKMHFHSSLPSLSKISRKVNISLKTDIFRKNNSFRGEALKKTPPL